MKIRLVHFATLAVLSINAAYAAPTTEAIQVNVRGTCIDAPPLNNGWGWDGETVCRVSAVNKTETKLVAANGQCIDTIPLNDGYGWTGTATCNLAPLAAMINSSSNSVGIFVNVRGNCVDAPPLNNGWGWNGTDSCEISASTRTRSLKIASNGNCIDTVPLNDGYGWNGSTSCDLAPLRTMQERTSRQAATSAQTTTAQPATIMQASPERPASTQPVATASTATDPSVESGDWWRPRASDNLKWQLQLQGDIKLIDGVDVYAVDYTTSQASINAAKATGAKLMCYLSAGSAENWRPDFNQFPQVVVGNAYEGWPGEWWLDTRNIDALAPIMRARIQACKNKGFDVIDPDNVNGFENNTGFPISRADSIRYIKWLAAESHRNGMAFSLKNSETLVMELLGDIDMMQSESCFRWGNCVNASRLSAVDKPVFAVEYEEQIDRNDFRNACDVAARYNLSMIYRDLYLTPQGTYEACD
ncbi:MAG: endo alpha-1,4 polygalactosaminidase [Granulosicoccus sp.]